MFYNSVVLFDTLAYANKLKEAGFSDKQAEAQAEALAHIFNHQVATKKDLYDTEMRLSSLVKSEISLVKSSLLKWFIGLTVSQFILFMYLFNNIKFFIKFI